MKAKISDYQSLLLEKQRLKLECSTQEKDMADNFVQLKAKLNPTLMIKEAILEIIPRDIRENSIVNLVSAFLPIRRSKIPVLDLVFFACKTSPTYACNKLFNKVS